MEDAINFVLGFQNLCEAYVQKANLGQITFNDGSTIGTFTLLQYGLGHKKLDEEKLLKE